MIKFLGLSYCYTVHSTDIHEFATFFLEFCEINRFDFGSPAFFLHVPYSHLDNYTLYNALNITDIILL